MIVEVIKNSPFAEFSRKVKVMHLAMIVMATIDAYQVKPLRQFVYALRIDVLQFPFGLSGVILCNIVSGYIIVSLRLQVPTQSVVKRFIRTYHSRKETESESNTYLNK